VLHQEEKKKEKRKKKKKRKEKMLEPSPFVPFPTQLLKTCICAQHNVLYKFDIQKQEGEK
jgi:hypothetical protein